MIKNIKSIRQKLFFTLCVVVLIIILFLIVLNTALLETFFYYTKQESSLTVYKFINEYYNRSLQNDINIELELEKAAVNNNFDIVIKNNDEIVHATNKDFLQTLGEIKDINYNVKYNIFNKSSIMFSDEKVSIRRIQDRKTGIDFILLNGELDCGYDVYIRIPIATIKESVAITNKLLVLIAAIAVVIGGIVISIVTDKFTKPIVQLNNIAKKMSRLDFSEKYRINDTEDEINELGKSMNTVSEKLEKTINKLKQNNMELEKDIERKSKIDEMRKQFISDVSHELKTPIALIQGYAEGLIENVNTDEESKKYYSEVILDEANKMDKLVKQLLELMKLEYGKREFNNKDFDIVELINEVIRKCSVMNENDVPIEFKEKNPIYVYADDFFIDQVVTNYYTNALKNVEEVNKKNKIEIKIRKAKTPGKLRISIYNTGKPIDEENLLRIWNRFYKVDKSRERAKGGTGIGLSLVKAIMNNYKTLYGAINKQDGVEFYFEIQEGKEI